MRLDYHNQLITRIQ